MPPCAADVRRRWIALAATCALLVLLAAGVRELAPRAPPPARPLAARARPANLTAEQQRSAGGSVRVATLLTGELRIAHLKHLQRLEAQLAPTDVHVVTYLRYAVLAGKLSRSVRERVVLIGRGYEQRGVMASMLFNSHQWYCLAVAIANFDFSGYDYVLRWRTDIIGWVTPSQLDGYMAGTHGVVLAWTDRAFAARPADFVRAYADLFEQACALYALWPSAGDSCRGQWREEVSAAQMAAYRAQAAAHPKCAGWRNGRQWWHEQCGCRYDGLPSCPWRYPGQRRQFASETAHTFHITSRGLTCGALVNASSERVPFKLRSDRGRATWGERSAPPSPQQLRTLAIAVLDSPVGVDGCHRGLTRPDTRASRAGNTPPRAKAKPGADQAA